MDNTRRQHLSVGCNLERYQNIKSSIVCIKRVVIGRGQRPMHTLYEQLARDPANIIVQRMLNSVLATFGARVSDTLVHRATLRQNAMYALDTALASDVTLISI